MSTLRKILDVVWDWEIAKPYFAIVLVGTVALALMVLADWLSRLM